MTHLTDYFFHPRPGSDQGQHTQESGDAGLSSNMEHRFSDKYTEGALPVAEKGSFVRPIPEEPDIRWDEIAEKIWSRPSVFGYAASPKADSHAVTAEEVLSQLLTRALVGKNIFPPQATPIAMSDNSHKPETVKASPGITAITEGQPDVMVIGEHTSIKNSKMEEGGDRAKPKGAPLNPKEGTKHRRKRATVMNVKMYLVLLMALIHVLACESFYAVRCFTCMDMDSCPKLMKIFDTNDTRLYERSPNQIFPGCSGISPPGPKNCTVCRGQSNITIICSEDVEGLEVEASDGKQILKISPGVCVTYSDEQQQTFSRTYVGLILCPVLLLLVVGVLVIWYRCYQKTRTENGPQ